MYPVNEEEHPTYYDAVDVPVALSDIKQRILWQQYPKAAAMEHDVRLLVRNAKAYNVPGSQVYRDAVALERVFRIANQKTAKFDEALVGGVVGEGTSRPRKRRRALSDADSGSGASDDEGSTAGAATRHDGVLRFRCTRCNVRFGRQMAKPGDEVLELGLPLMYAVPASGVDDDHDEEMQWVCNDCLHHREGGLNAIGWRVLQWTTEWDSWRAGVIDAFEPHFHKHRIVLDNGSWDFVDLTEPAMCPASFFKTRRTRRLLDDLAAFK